MKLALKHSCPGTGAGPCPAKAWVFTIKCDRCAKRGPFKELPPPVQFELPFKVVKPPRPIIEKAGRRRIEQRGHNIKPVETEVASILERFRERKKTLTRNDIY